MIDLMFLHEATVMLLSLIIIYLVKSFYHFIVWAHKVEDHLSIIEHTLIEMKKKLP